MRGEKEGSSTMLKNNEENERTMISLWSDAEPDLEA